MDSAFNFGAVCQTFSITFATILFAAGGQCWTVKDRVYCNETLHRGFPYWSKKRELASLYFVLIGSVTIAIATLVNTVFIFARKNSPTFQSGTQCCGGFWCVYLGSFTMWFAFAYSPIERGYSKEWIASGVMYMISAFMYGVKMFIEERREAITKSKSRGQRTAQASTSIKPQSTSPSMVVQSDGGVTL